MDISRAFIALPVACHCAALPDARAFAESSRQQLRWVARDNLHLTLAFLGRLSAAHVQDTCAVIDRVAAKFKVFEISFTRVGLFPEGRRPKILAALPEHSESLAKLQRALAHKLQSLAIYQQRRAYRPHITLARCRGASPDVQPATIALSYTAAELHLYQSVQTSAGVQYRSLCSAALIT